VASQHLRPRPKKKRKNWHHRAADDGEIIFKNSSKHGIARRKEPRPILTVVSHHFHHFFV
jgi:hypothetical protein